VADSIAKKSYISLYFFRKVVAPTTAQNMWMAKNIGALLLLLLVTPSTLAWGGLFNRFSPEMLSNLGYDGHGGGTGGYRAQPFLQVSCLPSLAKHFGEFEKIN